MCLIFFKEKNQDDDVEFISLCNKKNNYFEKSLSFYYFLFFDFCFEEELVYH